MSAEQLGESPPSIQNIVAVVNPVSSRLGEANAWLQGLKDSFFTAPPITLVETAADPAATHERLARVQHQIDKSTLFALIVGDGSTNQAVQWMVHPDTSPDVRQAQTLLLPGGTASDSALSLNQADMLADPSRVLDPRNRRLRELHPARMTTQNPNGEIETHVVVSYTGGGSNGWGIIGLGKQRERLEKLKAAEAAVRAAGHDVGAWLLAKHHEVREFTAAVLPGFYKPAFTVEYNNQTYDDVFDLLLMNGPVIARYGRSPASHHEPIMHVTMSRAPFGLAGRAPALIKNGLQLKMGRLAAEPLKVNANPSWIVRPQDGRDAVPWQYDGELTWVNGHAELSPAPPITVIANASKSDISAA